MLVAVGGGASSSAAENAESSGDEIVAHEAPGTGQAGIALIRGTDRVELVGERDGWSEIRLPDGRRAWVPSGEITRVAEGVAAPQVVLGPPPTETTPSGLAAASPSDAASSDAPTRELSEEIARLRRTVDELTAWGADRPDPPPASRLPDGASWVVGGLALAVGLLIGGAWERHRNRRERSLRF